MIISAPPIWWRDAPALRFLALFLLTWVGIRLISPMIETRGASVTDLAPPTLIIADKAAAGEQFLRSPAAGGDEFSEVAAAGMMPAPAWLARPHGLVPSVAARPKRLFPAARPPSAEPNDRPHGTAPFASLAAPALTPLPAPFFGPPQKPAADATALPAGLSSSGFSRRLAGWSLSAWALVREQGDGRQALPVVGELAGSQAGARVAYGFGTQGRLRAYGRASAALEHPRQSEAALGLTYAPIAALPVDVAVERRIKLGPDGRSAMAAMVVGGVSGRALPAHFRLDAYGQAGMVGLRSRDMFADGAVVMDRAVMLSAERKSLRVGMVVAGAAQPHLSRLDIGPRVTLPLPDVGQGARIAVDWRHRIMGQARPDSGLALTLGADF